MPLKADPPDFVDSGEYNVKDVSGWGMKVVGVAIGTALIIPALAVGVAGGRRLENGVAGLLGIQTENSNDGNGIVQFGGFD